MFEPFFMQTLIEHGHKPNTMELKQKQKFIIRG
jgi:hypothetical protein